MKRELSAEELQAIADCADLPTQTVIQDYPPSDGENWEPQCARCGSSVDWEDCPQCDEGYDGHDCGEDVCCCLYAEENVVCDICDGRSGWWRCISSEAFCTGNPAPEREYVPRGRIEWYKVTVRG